ncbi:MAG: hypothetical protein KGD61_10225, partial [Candidatus Lokiarchaeota archaeon]|nr:hypothetical protein [Candidatus Lokiarchaeota archaeon]
MIKKKVTISILIVLFSLLMLINVNDNRNVNYYDSSSFEQISNDLKTSASPVNGKSLLVNQYANISKSYNNVKSGDNVSFTLYDNWVSQNTTINYEGVAQKRDIVTNGAFDSDDSGWLFKTNIPSNLDKLSWQSTRGYPDSDGCTGLDGSNTARFAGDYGYFEQNVTLQNEVLRDDIATFSLNYNSDWFISFNASLFMSVIIGDIEINHSVYIPDIPLDTWLTLIMNYNPISYGQVLPGVATVRIGLIMNEDSGPGWVRIYLDNFKYELWSESNENGIIKALDNQFPLNHTYYNTTFGEGYSFINTERTPDLDHQIDFTIYSNKSGLSDFNIEAITIISHAIKKFNTTVSNNLGSLYTLGENISWQVEFSLTINNDYHNWIFIEKPSDWEFVNVFDGFEDDIVDFCIGKGLGSTLMEIPSNKINAGLWKLEAISKNYISNGSLEVWNSISFENTQKLNHGNIFGLSASLNNSLLLPNTRINCSIYYPNASLFWHTSREPTLHDEKFGNFTVGKNMTVGKYSVVINWVNNQSFFEIDKVGFAQFEFTVWHYTNLTAVTSNFEQIAGDPLLLKVKYTDFNLNSSIHFATMTYSSTFGASGTMVYLGSGVYFIDVDTNSLPLGDYYFSFNASKSFYENQTIVNLIHLNIVAQPLDLEVPHSALEGNANSIISCRINATGAISGTKIYPVNLTTDWFNPFNITDHNNGTYTLDFSTFNIPASGFLESFNIEIFANKTNYGSTNEFITLLVHPLSTVAYVNTSLVSVNSNNIINLKVNYTTEGSSEIITGSNCTVTWQSSFLITPVSDGFNIKLFTSGLAVDYYTVLIKLEKAGYEVAFESVTVILIEQDVNLIVSINSGDITENTLVDSFFQQTINISARIYAVIDEEFISGGIITLLSNNFQKNLTEMPSTYFSTSLILDGADFDSGINTIFLRFEQANYTTKIFPFQLFIRAQNVNLTTRINHQKVHEDYLLEGFFNQEFLISCRAFADIESAFLSGGNITFVNGDYEFELSENLDYWFNQTILISTSSFSIGPNYAYLRFQQNNYTTTIFTFQVFVNQLEINVDTIDFEGLVSGPPGETILIRLNLTETGSSNYVENATVFYSWNFGAGYFTYIGSGIYEK